MGHVSCPQPQEQPCNQSPGRRKVARRRATSALLTASLRSFRTRARTGGGGCGAAARGRLSAAGAILLAAPAPLFTPSSPRSLPLRSRRAPPSAPWAPPCRLLHPARRAARLRRGWLRAVRGVVLGLMRSHADVHLRLRAGRTCCPTARSCCCSCRHFAGVVGSVILPILGAVPDGAIMLFSLGPDARADGGERRRAGGLDDHAARDCRGRRRSSRGASPSAPTA